MCRKTDSFSQLNFSQLHSLIKENTLKYHNSRYREWTEVDTISDLLFARIPPKFMTDLPLLKYPYPNRR